MTKQDIELLTPYGNSHSTREYDIVPLFISSWPNVKRLTRRQMISFPTQKVYFRTFDINTLSAGGIHFNIALMSFFLLCQSFGPFCDFRVMYLKKYLSDATPRGFTLYHSLFIPITRNMFFILKNFWLLLLKQKTLYFAE